MKSLKSSPLVVRADACARIGTGHVMRCLALAQAWQDRGGQTIFLMASAGPHIEARLTAEGMEVLHLSGEAGSDEDAQMTARIANERGASWVVVDGYHFGDDYQHAIKDAGVKLLFFDDYGHADHYYADVVVNQNLHAHKGLYNEREAYTDLLLGTCYVLLRREFLKWKEWNRETPDVARRMLVTLGGGDADNVTLKVMEALEWMEGLAPEAVVVVGVENPHYDTIQSTAEKASFSVRILQNVQNMPELMAWSDLAVCAGGTTCWELASMGVPFLTVILAENQVGIAEGLEEEGYAPSCGWFHTLTEKDLSKRLRWMIFDKTYRERQSRVLSQLVDGMGRDRIIETMMRG